MIYNNVTWNSVVPDDLYLHHLRCASSSQWNAGPKDKQYVHKQIILIHLHSALCLSTPSRYSQNVRSKSVSQKGKRTPWRLGEAQRLADTKCYQFCLASFNVDPLDDNQSKRGPSLQLECWSYGEMDGHDILFVCSVVELCTFEQRMIILNINKIQRDATVCGCLFTAKLLYMFRVSITFRSTSKCNCSFWYRP